MRRITSLFMIAVLVSVTSVPLLPKAAICHAAEANAGCDTCHPVKAAIHEHTHLQTGPGMGMRQSMAHNGHHGSMIHRDMSKHSDHNMEQPKEMHRHQNQLSAAEKSCRIECGCGCHRSADGFPHLLAPHIAAIDQFNVDEQIVRAEQVTYPAPRSIILANPPPPPKTV